MENVTLTLKDGTKIETVLNGNNYISDTDVSDDLLTDENLSEMNFGDETRKNMRCTNHFECDGKFHFIFAEMTEQEMKERDTQSAVSMLTECLLEMSSVVYQ